MLSMETQMSYAYDGNGISEDFNGNIGIVMS